MPVPQTSSHSATPTQIDALEKAVLAESSDVETRQLTMGCTIVVWNQVAVEPILEAAFEALQFGVRGCDIQHLHLRIFRL